MSHIPRFAWLASLAILGSLSAVTTSTAEAQFGRRLKDAVKKTAEDKAIEKATEEEGKAIDSALNGGNEPARPAATETTPGEKAPEAPAGGAAPTAATATDSAGEGAATSPATKKVWANYDFVPGQRILFYSAFTEDQVGNFPQRLEFKTGTLEIVEFEGGKRALKASSASEFFIPLPTVLPDKYTIELDIIGRKTQRTAANNIEVTGAESFSDRNSIQVGWSHSGFQTSGGGLQGMMVDAKDADQARYLGKPAGFKLLGDGKYLKVYVDEKRLANIPNATFARGKAVLIKLEGRDDEDDAVYLTRIRIAESERSIYDALSSAGRWTTQGILFDTGKSDVKPESTPTLKQIAAALKEHPELKVEIQGHTDNVGKADANLKLSQARAEAVKAALTKEYGVGEGQLTAKGYGDTKPSGDNTTAEGRANNRRVELVKS
ncbi:MAG TPA: OmpA family protein [Gemmatimonadales bacterium]|nr:OmpA family protein [Gemmatimonadales bacterium]